MISNRLPSADWGGVRVGRKSDFSFTIWFYEFLGLGVWVALWARWDGAGGGR